jgi:tetratricopeptide (TPR) repeat protein
MDPFSSNGGTDSDRLISELINEYFSRRQAGEALTPERFVREHADVADQLKRHLDGLPLIESACSLGTHATEKGSISASAARLEVEGYELKEEIGRGGMGVVYKALQVSTKRIVALKVMLAGPFAGSSALRRFEREVELAARLQHPGIVRVLESGSVGEGRYYAMDYVPGTRLDRYLAESQADRGTTLKLFQQICEAVEHAHRAGVVHRDLKPGNVLVDAAGNPHILDFGLAKATDQPDAGDTRTTCVSLPGQVLGTLFYLSPEQAAGLPDEVDGRTDVYALGVMLFETLTGSLPFDTAGRPSEIIQRILETPPARPSSLSDRVDGELETIILKALAKEKDRRYQTAREMGEDLRRYLEGEPILARRPSSLYFLRKKIRKHRFPVAICAAAVVLVLIGLVGRSWSRQRALAQARQDALCCQRGLEYEGAERLLAEAQSLYSRRPQPPEAPLVWAQAQYRAEVTRNQGITFLERSVQSDPSNWAARALLAEVKHANGDAERADQLQVQVEREVPDTAEAWYLRSFATLDRGRALRCAQEAVQREPTHVLAWNRLTWLRNALGDSEGACRGADRLIELGEPWGEWSIFKGCVLARQGRFREAVEEFTRIMETSSPDTYSGTAQLYRAHACRGLREYERAIADYSALIDRAGSAPMDAWVVYQRATPRWILDRTDEALADYRQVRILLGRVGYSDVRSYIILRHLNRDEEAQQLWDAAVRDADEAWIRRILRCLAGKITPEKLVAGPEGRDDPERLCEAYYYAGEACLLAEQTAAARQWFEKCVETGVRFDPDIAQAVPMNEFELAQWRLETLPADVPSSQPEPPASQP